MAELRHAQAHPTKFWWNVYSCHRIWLLIYKVYCKYILCTENIVIASLVTFFLQAGVTSSSTWYYCKKPVSPYCSYKSIFWTLIAERMFHIQAIYKKSMANCVNCQFLLNLQLFSFNLKSAPVKHTPTYCHWDSHQIHSSCTYMSVWWQNNPSSWLSWTVSIPKWVSILWHAARAPNDAKLLEGGVSLPMCIYLRGSCSGNMLVYLWSIYISDRIRIKRSGYTYNIHTIL